MKILFVGTCTFDSINERGELSFSGGTEVFNHILLTHFLSDKDKYDITYAPITGSEKFIGEHYSDHYGIPIKKVLLNNLESAEKFRDYLQTAKVDLIVISGFYGVTYGGLKEYDIVTGIKTPIIYFLHGVNCSPNMVVLEKLCRTNQNISFINSQESAKEKYYPHLASKDQLLTVTYPVLLKEDHSELTDNSNKKSAFICARVCMQKGLEDAIDLLLEEGYTIDLAGRFSMTRPGRVFYEKYIKSNLINFLGVITREEVVSNMKSHSFTVLLPKGLEGASLVLKESQFLGTPVITWNNRGLDVIVENNLTFEKKITRDKFYLKREFESRQDDIDRVLSLENRYELREKAQNLYGLKRFYESLDTIIENVLIAESER